MSQGTGSSSLNPWRVAPDQTGGQAAVGILFFKWLHIIAVISWMAGVLYLFRLFVYHAEKGGLSPEVYELLTLMEKRLYRYITIPAMLLSWAAGLCLLWLSPAYLSQGWMHAKLLLVILLTGATHYGGALHKKFAAHSDRIPGSRFLRFFNEVPALLMVFIVFLVVFRLF